VKATLKDKALEPMAMPKAKHHRVKVLVMAVKPLLEKTNLLTPNANAGSC
jgi:hypothetical protein